MTEKKRPVGRPEKDVKADKRIGLRVTESQDIAWTQAAVRDGYTTKSGKANVSAWLKDLADEKAK